MIRRDELDRHTRREVAEAKAAESKESAWVAASFVAIMLSPCIAVLGVSATIKLLWWLW